MVEQKAPEIELRTENHPVSAGKPPFVVRLCRTKRPSVLEWLERQLSGQLLPSTERAPLDRHESLFVIVKGLMGFRDVTL